MKAANMGVCNSIFPLFPHHGWSSYETCWNSPNLSEESLVNLPVLATSLQVLLDGYDAVACGFHTMLNQLQQVDCAAF